MHNRAAQIFRMAAFGLQEDSSSMGHYLRRMKSKIGPAGATTATAHKIAVIFYTLVKKQVEYDETMWAQRDLHRQKRIEQRLKRQAYHFGYQLVPIEEVRPNA